jgi:hypothetical protein
VFQGIRGLTMPLLGWLLFQHVSIFLLLAPTVLNVWSLAAAVQLWRRTREHPPEKALLADLRLMEDQPEP